MRIGLDFDNTIINYDHVFYAVACERGWIPRLHNPAKKAVRDSIRLLPEGEQKWMALQAEVYGPRIADADLMPGVADFLRSAREHDVPVVIISHKSQFAAAAPQGPDLRQAALRWMREQDFFSADGIGLQEKTVHFADSRTQKCELIGALGCTHFIDDLEEVLRDPAFPQDVAGMLYSPMEDMRDPGPFRVMHSWREIQDACFGSQIRHRRRAI